MMRRSSGKKKMRKKGARNEREVRRRRVGTWERRTVFEVKLEPGGLEEVEGSEMGFVDGGLGENVGRKEEGGLAT